MRVCRNFAKQFILKTCTTACKIVSFFLFPIVNVKKLERSNSKLSFVFVFKHYFRVNKCTSSRKIFSRKASIHFRWTITQYTQQHSFQLNHRLIIELDLQSLFGLLVHSCTHWQRPANPPPPTPHSVITPHLGSYTGALLVSQERRHIFVTSWVVPNKPYRYVIVLVYFL